MKRAKRLTIVLGLANREEEAAATRLQEATQLLSNEEQKLDQLSTYYREYEMQFRQQQSLSPNALAGSRNFLSNLSQALDVQKSQIDVAARQVEAAKTLWRRCHMKRTNMQSLIARLVREDRLDEERLEQKRVDDWVNGRYR